MRVSSYENSCVVIAGGASGMGKQVAVQVSHRAAQVYILDRQTEQAQDISEQYKNISLIKTELGDPSSVDQALTAIRTDGHAIDYFFNFAGTFMAGEIRDTPLQNWEAIFTTNIPPMLVTTEQVYALMREQGHGTIVNTASAAGIFPVPAMSLYGATKSAVMSLTLGLRAEAKTFSINVSVVCPTIVNTPLYDTALYNKVNKDKALHALRDNPSIQQSDVAAKRILRGVQRNKAIIHTSVKTKATGLAFHLFPSGYLYFAQKFFAVYRKSLRED